jgi:mRNA-degrading endonuclease RelE of RelBE toxin-antitoxin system
MKRVLFRPRAVKDLEGLEGRDREQVEEAIEKLARTGQGDVKKLVHRGSEFRLRVGVYRVRFLYEPPDVIRVLHIRHRREAYRG